MDLNCWIKERSIQRNAPCSDSVVYMWRCAQCSVTCYPKGTVGYLTDISPCVCVLFLNSKIPLDMRGFDFSVQRAMERQETSGAHILVEIGWWTGFPLENAPAMVELEFFLSWIGEPSHVQHHPFMCVLKPFHLSVWRYLTLFITL